MTCKNNNSIRTPLARARGTGANGHGATHWIRQRATALVMVPLMIWLFYWLPQMAVMSHQDFTSWMQTPFNAILMAFFVLAALWHAALGMQVIIEDYIHCRVSKPFLILAVYAGCAFLALSGLFSLITLKIGS